MKKLISILLTFVLLLSVIIVPVYADNNVQKIFGQLTSIGSHSYTISDENGTALITAEAVADGITLSLEEYAWFTVETLTDEYGDYLCITDYEIIPEYGYEIAYLSRVYEQLDGVLYIELFTDKQDNMRMYPVRINNSTYRNNADIISALKPQVGKFIGYRLDEDGDIRRIVFIDTKTPKEKYKVNADTKYFIKNGTYYQISDLPNGHTYSYEVLSYDKEYNALSVVVTDMYKYGMEFFTAYNDDYCYTRDEKGNIKRWECSDSSLFDDISAKSMVEFTYNENDGIKSAKVVESTDFQGYTYDKDNNTFGGYSLDNTSLLTVEFNEMTGNVKTYEPITPNENLQYSGKIYTSSFGKNVLWITDSAPIAGNPVIDFFAQDNRDGTFKVGATYEKNGYTGSGTMYLAVYYQGRLYRLYTYNLADEGSAYDEEWDELDPVIFDRRIPYKDGTDKYDYTVSGFVWNDNLSPMYPAVPVWD